MARTRENKATSGLPLVLSPKTAALVAQVRATRASSEFACPSLSAIRREDTERDRDTPARPAFVRDAEKIMHLPAYNRLAGKTQVFSFRSDDDISRRGLHVQLVCRIARDIGRNLGLNDDLIEAIALGHDIGHTPFGHAGEKYLNETYLARTGRWFFHNVNSVRVLDVLYGRNLALQTLDGIICHNGEFEQQTLETSDLSSFADFDGVVEACWSTGDPAIGHLRPMTLEGCVVRLSDIIAYVGKDRQDAISAGLVSPDAFEDGLGGAYNAWALTAFSTDIVEHSFGEPRIQMSEEAFHELKRAKAENYEMIYGSSEVNGEWAQVVKELFGELYLRLYDDLSAGDERSPIFSQHVIPVTRFLEPYGRRYSWQDNLDLTVVDYISSMTDEYFIAICERLFPKARDLFPRRSYFDDVDPGWR